MIPIINRGKLIVLQGLDRSGKSSVTKFVKEFLLEHKMEAVQMNFPDRTTIIGKMIDGYLSNQTDINNETIHLLFSANRWENMGKIESLLAKGTNVVCDRYWYSGVAYSCAKGMNYEWCIAPDRGLIEPDLVIYLHADPQVLKSRSNYGEEKYERLEFQKKVGQVFKKMLVDDKNPKIKVVEVGGKNLQEVVKEAKEVVSKLIETK